MSERLEPPFNLTHIVFDVDDLRTLCGRSARSLAVVTPRLIENHRISGEVICPECDVELAVETSPDSD